MRGLPPALRAMLTAQSSPTLRDCVEWSDGEAFNADDVVFTTDIAMINEEISSREASTIRE